jgi:hypothetical protein
VEAIGPLLIVLSIPLAFRWIPPNRLYGFRVGATLRNRSVWYDVNAQSARQCILLGAVMVGLEFVLPLTIRNQVLATLGIAGLALITVINWRQANQLERRRRDLPP